jgi:hypothetical protein
VHLAPSFPKITLGGSSTREKRRRAAAASNGEAMADAVANIAVLDTEPRTDIEPGV